MLNAIIYYTNWLRRRQNGRHSPNDILKCVLVNDFQVKNIEIRLLNCKWQENSVGSEKCLVPSKRQAIFQTILFMFIGAYMCHSASMG